ncbi:Uncharacterised protein [Mycobacteroides abscessus subsp. bolletii]|uniref:hypothetical protein n=1 Tax=Mycobacteroides abscessus TaxID=36809 RepID=UPI0009D60F88|nr:hypothetical protein [Mycobacteroides abscessus]SLF33444.1 Uncharacterised protein [Mycobacteroides abscessus subsp. bolletii]
MPDNQYCISEVPGSLPTIINSRSGASVLAIDEREVSGAVYTTPVFASRKIAELVLSVLNSTTE